MVAMNESEKKAYRWLQEEKGYDKKEIIRKSHKQTPDFITEAGQGYEVKRNYNGTIVFHENQMDDISKDTEIIIVSEQKIKQVQYSKLEDSAFSVKIQESPDSKQKRIQPDLVREIEQYSGGSFSEKMVKWRNDVDISLDFDFKDLENKINEQTDTIIEELGGRR